MTQTSRLSLGRDVSDHYVKRQYMSNYRDPKNKIGALGGNKLKNTRFRVLMTVKTERSSGSP